MILQQGTQLEKHLMGFHCNHSQKTTPLHGKNHLENNWNRFISNPHLQPCIPHNSWGLPADELEEIRLKNSNAYLS